MNPRILVAGVDSSTQSTKVEVRDLDTGEVVAVGRAPHPPVSPPVSEQDPQAWWAALAAACADAGPLVGEVAAVSVAAQQHGLVVLDEGGRVLRPAKLWNDTTSAPEAAELVTRAGAGRWARGCGLVPVASFTVTKLAWLVHHEPDVARRVTRVMLPHDWLTWRLTGAHVTDRGDASGTGWWDPRTGRYRADLLDLVGGRSGADWVATLPRVLGPTAEAGRVTAEAAATTGLPAGIPVGPGTGDNMAAALGLGLDTGDLAVSLGTSGTVYAVAAEPVADPSGLVAGFADAAGGYLPLVCTLNATRVTDTVAAWLGVADQGPGALDRLALEAGPGAGGVTLVPWFDGERTPNLPGARGWVQGVSTTTGPAEIARAAFEGVVCGLLAGVDALARVGVDTGGSLHLIGGGARSRAYRRIVADLWGRGIVVPDADEMVATGACVQAAAVLSGSATTPVAVARRWGLGRGERLAPSAGAEHGPAVRERYRRLTGALVAAGLADAQPDVTVSDPASAGGSGGADL